MRRAAVVIALLLAPPAAAQQERGEELYLQDCAWCHGPDGRGTQRGPTLEGTGGAATHFQLTSGRMPIPEPRRARRSEPQYPQEEIDAIALYVATLVDGPEVPDVDLEEADVTRGSALYRRDCAACHGFAGAGGPLSAGRLSPGLGPVTPVEAAAAMLTGPGTMPSFGPPRYDEAELRDVAAYVAYLGDPDNPGGSPLGGIGPVAEGLVAIVAAFLLLALIRWGIGGG